VKAKRGVFQKMHIDPALALIHGLLLCLAFGGVALTWHN
jgi:hypothetical protein